MRVVAIGGGTGLSTLLRGLRRYAPSPQPAEADSAAVPSLISDLAAVVTVTDDGGSSGRLRRHFRNRSVVDDCFNITPTAVARELLTGLPGAGWAVKGAVA